MGAAGDMLTAALLALLPDPAPFLENLRALLPPEVTVDAASVEKRGVVGTRVTVRARGEEERSVDVFPETHTHDSRTHTHTHAGHAHEHTHGLSYASIMELIRGFDLPDKVKSDALAVYKRLADAEGAVHGAPPEQIHFHEVGTLDALADIVGVCLLIHMLGVTELAASPVHVGSGSVRCSHGVLPVPAPATALILQGVPIYGGKIRGELCTPTGAALLRHFVARFGDMTPMSIQKIGYGMGTKDFETLNCVRAFLGETADGARDEIVELVCNLDDMTPEAIGAAAALLLEQGAPDVFTTPITMKKNRPAVLLTCLCRPGDEDKFTRLLFLHTTTLGVRVTPCRRAVLRRAVEPVATQYGEIRVKRAEGYGAAKSKPEYDDVIAAATAHGVPFQTVYDEAKNRGAECGN
jgi:uncharacterized protein (TIGR00299 family) protein